MKANNNKNGRDKNSSGGGGTTRRSLREKKRSRLHRQLHRMSPDEFHRRCASHIRAIRYLRLRNQEIAVVNCIVRLRQMLNNQQQTTRRIPRLLLSQPQQQQQQQNAYREGSLNSSRESSSSSAASTSARTPNRSNKVNDGNSTDIIVIVRGAGRSCKKTKKKPTSKE